MASINVCCDIEIGVSKKKIFPAKITVLWYKSILWNKIAHIVIWDFGCITHPHQHMIYTHLKDY